MDEETSKKIKIIAVISSMGFIPLLLFALFVSVFLVLGLFESSSGGSSSGGVTYESECNYEETKVTVMSKRNNEILATVSLEDYILGVLCGESGICDGQVASINEHYIKTQIIAYKTYTLGRRSQYNSSTKSIVIKASTRDQQWCSIEKGCKYTKDTVPGEYYNGNPVYYHNTYPKDYDESKFENEKLYNLTRSYTEEDLELLRKYYADTYGELFLPNDYNKAVTSLTSNESTSYASKLQNFWKDEAAKGKTYEEILEATPSSGVRYSDEYEGKSIYKLGDYCKSTGHSSSVTASISYVQWMIDFADDDSHGYSMPSRTMNPDVDCSSFVYYALLNNGYTTSQLGTYPFTTRNMSNILTSIGFEKISFDYDKLQEGDILWRSGHTEVYIGDGKNVGAHWNYDGKTGDGAGDEVNIASTGTNWTYIFRIK